LGERILKHLQNDPPDLRQFNPQVSDELWTLIQRMLAKNPEDRFQTPAQLLKALKDLPPQASDGEPIRLPRSHGSHPPPSSSERSPDPATAAIPSTQTERPAAPRPRLRQIEDDPGLLGLRGDQLQTAARQYQRAEEARANGNLDYAIELLLSCTKLDPVSIVYRQLLRESSRAADQQKRGSWLSSLTTLTTRARVTAAKRAKQHRKVLEEGEEVLVRHPGDIKTQIAMAEAAQELGLIHLAEWMLEEICQQDRRHLPARRTLARLYEKERRYSEAIAVWESVCKVAPHDGEAKRKIQDLAASETIARGNYRR
jgi:tetratricopeptide (TPR) repeat protein